MGSRSFQAICALILANQLGFGIVIPVLPSFARSFGIGPTSVGMVVAIYGAARLVANVPAGRLSERRGRREVMILGTAITSVASLLTAFAGGLWQLLLCRALSGVGAATVLTVGQVMVSDLATSENRGRMMSTYQGFFLVGAGLGPIPGGILADAFGLRAPFVAYSAFSACACLVALFLLAETKPADAPRPAVEPSSGGVAPESALASPAAPPLRRTLMSSAFLLIGVVSFAQFFARTGGIFTLMPLVGSERLQASATQVGLAAALVSAFQIATLYHSGVISDRYGRKMVIGPATIAAGIGLALLGWAPSYVVFVIAAGVWGIGAGMAGPTPAAYVADFAPAEQRGRIFGYWRSVADCGYVIGPLSLGFLADHFGYGTPLLLTAVLIVTAGLAFWWFAPEFVATQSRGWRWFRRSSGSDAGGATEPQTATDNFAFETQSRAASAVDGPEGN